MLTRNRRELNEKISLVKEMNRDEAFKKLDNIWRHGTTSIFELKTVVDRIKNS